MCVLHSLCRYLIVIYTLDNMPSYAVAALKRKFGEKYEMYTVALSKKVYVMQLQQGRKEIDLWRECDVTS
jgi:hypothetical protein